MTYTGFICMRAIGLKPLYLIGVMENRQHSSPISIGDYTFVGTNVVILGGASLPAFSDGAIYPLWRRACESRWHH